MKIIFCFLLFNIIFFINSTIYCQEVEGPFIIYSDESIENSIKNNPKLIWKYESLKEAIQKAVVLNAPPKIIKKNEKKINYPSNSDKEFINKTFGAFNLSSFILTNHFTNFYKNYVYEYNDFLFIFFFPKRLEKGESLLQLKDIINHNILNEKEREIIGSFKIKISDVLLVECIYIAEKERDQWNIIELYLMPLEKINDFKTGYAIFKGKRDGVIIAQ